MRKSYKEMHWQPIWNRLKLCIGHNLTGLKYHMGSLEKNSIKDLSDYKKTAGRFSGTFFSVRQGIGRMIPQSSDQKRQMQKREKENDDFVMNIVSKPISFSFTMLMYISCKVTIQKYYLYKGKLVWCVQCVGNHFLPHKKIWIRYYVA